MHVFLCMCVNVFIQACLCALTKLFHLSHSLSLVWFWQLFQLSFEGDITLRILGLVCAFVCVCVCVHYVSDDRECVYITHVLTIMC